MVTFALHPVRGDGRSASLPTARDRGRPATDAALRPAGTCLVALIVGGLTTVLAPLVPEGPLPLLAASAVVAILVHPRGGAARPLVDRLVLGERADPLTLVDRVGAGLEVATDDPVASMLEAVAAAAGASYAVGARTTTGANCAECGRARRRARSMSRWCTAERSWACQRRPAPRRAAGDRSATRGSCSPSRRTWRSWCSSRRLTEELAQERKRVAAATLAERDRLRRDLHDGLGPSLSGIALGLEAAGTALARDPAAVPELLERTRLEAEGAVREIRRVLDGPAARGARPAWARGRGARHRVDSSGWGSPGRPHFELRVDTLPSLSSEVEESAFRIVAESMTNVARHSGADHCRVQINQANGDLNIRVTDDGHGFARAGSTGHGLDSMRRRASDIGGRFSVAPIDPHGTAVTAALPLRASS